MKYVEKTEIYTDGFYNAHLHSHRRGYTITYLYKGAFRGDTDYFVSEYGSRAERAFIEFARFDERNNSRTSMHVMLESGLTEFLREARMATLNSDAVRDFNVAVSNVCNMHKQQEQSVTYSSNAAAFK